METEFGDVKTDRFPHRMLVFSLRLTLVILEQAALNIAILFRFTLHHFIMALSLRFTQFEYRMFL